MWSVENSFSLLTPVTWKKCINLILKRKEERLQRFMEVRWSWISLLTKRWVLLNHKHVENVGLRFTAKTESNSLFNELFRYRKITGNLVSYCEDEQCTIVKFKITCLSFTSTFHKSAFVCNTAMSSTLAPERPKRCGLKIYRRAENSLSTLTCVAGMASTDTIFASSYSYGSISLRISHA